MYRLLTATLRDRLTACRNEHAKARHSQARRVQANRERRFGVPAPPAPAAKPVLLAQGKLVTFDRLYNLALYQAGAYRHARAAEAALYGYDPRNSGVRVGPTGPAPLEFPARELLVRTTQEELADKCSCDVRTLRRHLKTFEALGLVKRRRQLGVAVAGAPSFELVLNAAFLDWEEVPARGEGALSVVSGPPAPAQSPTGPTGPTGAPEPPAPAFDAARILRRTAQRQAAAPGPPA